MSGIRMTADANGQTIYWPAGAPRGGVVCLHGSEGGWAGWNDANCALLAASGFAAMSHSYSQRSHWPLPPDIDDVPLESTERALAAMRAAMAPFGCGLGLFGASRGAERALLITQLLIEEKSAERPDALALHSPPDETWPAFLVADFLPGAGRDVDLARTAWSWRGRHDRTRPGLALGEGLGALPVLILQGAEDSVWDARMAVRLAERMARAGHTPELHVFEGEDHSFRPEARTRAWGMIADFFARSLVPGVGAPA